MDPITQLTEEHVTFRTALKKLEDPHGASGTRASRFAEVAHLLAVHSAGERSSIPNCNPWPTTSTTRA